MAGAESTRAARAPERASARGAGRAQVPSPFFQPGRTPVHDEVRPAHRTTIMWTHQTIGLLVLGVTVITVAIILLFARAPDRHDDHH
jgi:hypothetical protein